MKGSNPVFSRRVFNRNRVAFGLTLTLVWICLEALQLLLLLNVGDESI
ncbi:MULTISPECIES: hypothetical protein [unclassified Streptomyces]